MCIQHILISRRPLSEVRDDPNFPDLLIESIPEDSDRTGGIRKIFNSRFAYSVRPSELCGCYFTYPNRSEHEARLAGVDGDPALSGEDLRIAEWIWRQGHNSVNSFRQYVDQYADAADLTLYVCWEHDEGKPIEHQHTVEPGFFSGPDFARLEENTVLTIRNGDTSET